jgi:hypothetical protein
MHVILATQEAEIRRITVQSQPGHTVQETLSRKNPSQKRAEVAQDAGPRVQTPVLQKKRKEKRKKERKMERNVQMAQMLWKTAWQCLKMLNTELSYDSVILLRI